MNVIAPSLKTRFWAPNRSSFPAQLHAGPAQIWPYACVPDPNRSEPSREGRASVFCSRAVERRFPARYLRTGDSDFVWGGKIAIYRNGGMEPLPNLLYSSKFPPQIYSQATGVKGLCNGPRFFGFHTGKTENTTLSTSPRA